MILWYDIVVRNTIAAGSATFLYQTEFIEVRLLTSPNLSNSHIVSGLFNTAC